jgi:hypothetical protein
MFQPANRKTALLFFFSVTFLLFFHFPSQKRLSMNGSSNENKQNKKHI